MTAVEETYAPTESTVDWERLDIRVVWVNLIAFLLSLGSGITGLVMYPDGELWPLLIACGAGVIGTVVDLWRWFTTSYRITETHVEKRTGVLRKEFRQVARERIRSVDTSAKLRHRLAKLRIVHIAAGDTRMHSTFTLNALRKDAVIGIRRELVPEHAETNDDEIVVSRVRWWWIFYNMFQFWAILAAGFLMWAVYWGLDEFGVNLFDVLDHLRADAGFGLTWTIAIAVLATLMLGWAALAAEFIGKYWAFELVRTKDEGGALLTRHGLFSTHTVHRDESRIRGIHIYEPLVLRFMRLAETTVVTTGIHPLQKESAHILPRCPVGEARHAAKFVLPGDVQPLEAPLLRHPLSALRQRLIRATYESAIVAGLLYWLVATDVFAEWVWQIPVWTLPLAWILAVIDYFTLGHTLVGPYLVVRSGAVGRATTALQTRAVAGWTLHQTLIQRIGKRMTVEVLTAAGHRHYRAPDAGVQQALAFVSGATPGYTTAFIEKTAPADQGNVTTGGCGGGI